MGVEIFVVEVDDRFNVFFGHELTGHIKKDKVAVDKETLEFILRSVSYKYTNFINRTGEFAPKPQKTYGRTGQKEDGIFKEIWGWFW